MRVEGMQVHIAQTMMAANIVQKPEDYRGRLPAGQKVVRHFITIAVSFLNLRRLP